MKQSGRDRLRVAFGLTFGVALLAASNAMAGRYEDGVYIPDGVCVSGCEEEPSGGGYVAPSGPTEEELRQQREEQDTQEAADDASDRGVRAYNAGDYETAAKYFREAYGFRPDDPVIKANLDKANARVSERIAEQARRSEALRQLQSVQSHSSDAATTVDSLEARKGLDTAGREVPVQVGTPVAGKAGSGDPVVAPAKRTPAITRLEKQRSEVRQQVQVLEEKLKKIDAGSDPVAAAKVKQEISNAQNKVNYLNFSIGEMLDKPATPGAGKPAGPKAAEPKKP